MIEKMQKLSLLILRSSKDLFLSELQTLGAVQLECDKSVQNDEITILKEKSGRFEKVAKYLAEVKSQIKSPLSDKNISDDEDLEKIVSSVEKIKGEIDDLNTQVDNLKKEVAQIEPWGIFDEVDITRLEKIGLQIKFFSAQKSKFDKIDKSLFPIEVISRIKGTVYFAVVADMEENISIVGANEERFPIKNSKELKDKIETLTCKKTDKTEEAKEFVCYIDSLKEIVLKYEDKISYRIVNANLSPEADGELLYVSGWVPERNIKDVKSFLNLKDVVFILEQPKENEVVPIKLKNNAFNRLFEPIGKMFSLPNYHEIDPTPFFAPFFTLFFGLCMGDVGYGLIIFVAALVGFILIKSKGLKPFMLLGVILGIASMFSGLILNTFFGIPITDMRSVPQWIKQFAYFSNMMDAMSFAVMLGVIQVIFGYVIQVFNKIKSNGIRAGLQPLGVALLLTGLVIYAIGTLMGGNVAIGPIKVGEIIKAIPAGSTVGLILMFLGLFFILFFNNIDKAIFIRPLTGLWEMYNIITGIPGDILSYIRLFALGLAGGLLGQAFNGIGVMIMGDTPSIGGVIGAVFVLLIGHGLNLALAALSAFVHPLRLTLLEFYKSIGFSGGGKEYTPFKIKSNI